MNMKTTIELPDTLVREIEKMAVLEGCKFNDILTTLLRAGLASEAAQSPPRTSPRKGSRAAVVRPGAGVTAKSELTPERIADILHAHNALWQTMACGRRASLSDLLSRSLR